MARQKPPRCPIWFGVAPLALGLALPAFAQTEAKTKTRDDDKQLIDFGKGDSQTATFATPPEWDYGCPVPTEEECLSLKFLSGKLDDELGCGALQADHPDWTCGTLYSQSHSQYPKKDGVIAHELAPHGVAQDIARVPQSPSDASMEGTADPAILASTAYQASLGIDGPNQFAAIDPYEGWSDSGVAFASCQEYATERYWELNAFWHAVDKKRHDYLETYKIAFGSAYNDASIGTHRSNGQLPESASFTTKSGTSSGIASYHWVYRNHFFDLPELPGIGQVAVLGGPVSAPNLSSSLAGYSEFGADVVERALENRTVVDKNVPDTKIYFQQATVEGKPVPGFQGTEQIPTPSEPEPAPGSIFTTQEPEPDPYAGPGGYADEGSGDMEELIETYGQVDLNLAVDKVLRRLFVAEYDELYDLQVERDELVRQWHRLDERYAGSGWRVTDLLDELTSYEDTFTVKFPSSGGRDDDDDDTGILVYSGTGSPYYATATGGSGGTQVAPLGPQYTTEEPDEGDPGFEPGFDEFLGNGGDDDDDGSAVLSEESAARKAVLDRLLALYEIADAWGCLDDGFTYCEFSLKQFAHEIVVHADEQTQGAYEECIEYLPSPYWSNFDEPRVFIDPVADLEDFQPIAGYKALQTAYDNLVTVYPCSHTLTEPMTPTKYTALKNKTAQCEAKLADYQQDLAAYLELHAEAVATEEAKARLAAIPELYDPATGAFNKPGVGKAYDSYTGGDYFGLGLNYEYRFDTSIPQNDVCQFQVTAGGDLNAYAKVLGHDKSLVDVAAWLRTADEDPIEVRAKVLGVSIFNDGDIEWPDNNYDVELNIDFVSQSKRQDLAAYNQPFVLGIIPMNLRVGAAGELGYGTAFSAGLDTVPSPENHCPQAGATVTLEPFLGVNGFIEVSLSVLIAEVGIRGEITVIKLSLPAQVGIQAQSSLVNAVPDVDFVIDTNVKARFTTLEGRILVYAQVGIGALKKRWEKPIVKWDGFSWDKTLFAQTYNVSVGDLILAGVQ